MSNYVEGLIGHYGLNDWWLTTFSEEERAMMSERFRPVGLPPHSLTKGRLSTGHPVDLFLNGLATWFRSPEHRTVANRIHSKLKEISSNTPRSGPGNVKGRHFSTYVEDVRQSQSDGDDREELLKSLIDATEAESKADGCGVAPWYYEELAKLYRRRKEYAMEISILERFASQKHAPGVKPPRLLARLEKARLLSRNKDSKQK